MNQRQAHMMGRSYPLSLATILLAMIILLGITEPAFVKAQDAAPIPSQEMVVAEAIAERIDPVFTSDPSIQNFDIDLSDRITIPVQINGSTAYPFIVDTGSQRTVIATDLAEKLALEKGAVLRLITVSGKASAPSFIINSLTAGSFTAGEIEAPGLERANIGAYGLLGIDSLDNNKLIFNIRRRIIEVFPSPRRSAPGKLERDMIVVRATRRDGQLILHNARVNGIAIDLVIDTGSQSSLGNYTLRDMLSRKDRKTEFMPVALQTVTGETVMGEYTQLRNIKIGDLDIKGLPITFSENYALKSLFSDKRPAILLGMDALSLFDTIIIDFTNRRVSFSKPN
jgi:predicted aspartyl protease